ncbi:MAG: flippase activity-associated protein Agl23, partial [Dehalococcoidia bacterium]
MSELAEPIGIKASQEGLLNRLASIQVRVSWEVAAYAALMIAAAGMRFWDLGSRSLNHDEGIHGLYAWRLFSGMGYEHFPLVHGPFQFFGTAFSFFLFGGAGDYTLRILPAIFGSALVALPFFLRHRLGTVGALLAAAAIAFSPTLLFFSRFARNDIYVAFFTLGLVVCLWRYIDERKHGYLYLGALLLGLSFATKENTFINVAVLVAFLNLWLAVHFWRQLDKGANLSLLTSFLALVFLLPFAWAVAALWPFSRGLRERVGLEEWHPAADFLIVLGTLSLPQFAAAIQVPLEALLGIDEGDLAAVVWSDASFGPFDLGTVTRENLLGSSTIVALIAATAVIGLRWNPRAWLLVAAAFYIPYVLLFTSFFTNVDGFYSGNWNSLDYWLDQQDVRRGNQPWFYYLMLLPSYEFLPLLFAAPALFYHAVTGDIFRRFLVFWVVATLFGYSMAGEKMPWNSVHTSLPVIILAACFLAGLFARLPVRGIASWPASHLLPLLAGALGLAAVGLGVFGPEGGPWFPLRILVVFAAVVGTLYLLLPLAVQRAATVIVS